LGEAEPVRMGAGNRRGSVRDELLGTPPGSKTASSQTEDM